MLYLGLSDVDRLSRSTPWPRPLDVMDVSVSTNDVVEVTKSFIALGIVRVTVRYNIFSQFLSVMTPPARIAISQPRQKPTTERREVGLELARAICRCGRSGVAIRTEGFAATIGQLQYVTSCRLTTSNSRRARALS